MTNSIKTQSYTYTTIEFKVHGGRDGALVALEEESEQVPFNVKRVYYIFKVGEGLRRGFHAHKNLKQLLVALSGHCNILLDNGKFRETVTLNQPNIGILLEKQVWREMYDFSEDCVLMVLASEHYSPKDYVKDYKEFKKMVLKKNA
jgi:dTDP-4-dehydrorhamnose 3,5-epimerase-like enzyme